jgi:hypothetical protein
MILTVASGLQTVAPYESERICQAEAARLTTETERAHIDAATFCVPEKRDR